MIKNRAFKVIESYKHYLAKQILSEWLTDEYTIRREEKFFCDDIILFVPDIVAYRNNIIQAFYEIVHKHEIDGRKLAWMQYWCYRNDQELLLHEISAEWIMCQTGKPERIIDINTYQL